MADTDDAIRQIDELVKGAGLDPDRKAWRTLVEHIDTLEEFADGMTVGRMAETLRDAGGLALTPEKLNREAAAAARDTIQQHIHRKIIRELMDTEEGPLEMFVRLRMKGLLFRDEVSEQMACIAPDQQLYRVHRLLLVDLPKEGSDV